MSYPCEIKEQESQPALAIRTNATLQTLPAVIGRSFGDIYKYIQSIGENPSGAPYVAYFNYPNMDMQHLEIELGFPVSKKIPGKGDILLSEMPGGKVATCLYTGAYDNMEPAYTEMTRFVEDQGYKIAGVTYEFYLDPPETSPEKTRTLILFPLTQGS
jgi:effector-binding domain-containing protein